MLACHLPISMACMCGCHVFSGAAPVLPRRQPPFPPPLSVVTRSFPHQVWRWGVGGGADLTCRGLPSTTRSTMCAPLPPCLTQPWHLNTVQSAHTQ